LRSSSSVREALVASVAWIRPPVSFQSSQLSGVPKATRPARAARVIAGECRSSQAILVPEK